MFPFKKSESIADVTFDQTVKYPKTVKRFTEIAGLHPIPTDRIIYKTVTGIGATHSEIVAKRHSIIVLPHISIVTSKAEYYRSEGFNIVGVYGEIKPEQICEYLLSVTADEHAKFLTTPKGLEKIIKVFNYFRFDYKSECFLLVDECHKTIKDANYRIDILEVMDLFFDFKQKAMVSATPIPPSDPRFIDHGFKNIKVEPEAGYCQDIELIHADSLVNGVEKYISDNPVDHYFIFFNSIEGIVSLLDKLKIYNDYKIYCAQESCTKLALSGNPNATNNLGDFVRFNFFTSSFFNGLDIYLPYKPNVIVLTDFGYRDHTLLDPFTDVLQIAGRFRKGPDGEQPYNKLTHINNTAHFTTPKPESELLSNIKLSKDFHFAMETLKNSLISNEFKNLFDQALGAIKPYSNLLRNDILDPYLFDKFFDYERVKGYYQSPTNLRNAYYQSRLFNIDDKRDRYEKHERIKLQKSSIGYSKQMNELMANTLLELEEYRYLQVFYEQREIVQQLSYVTVEAFERLGYFTMSGLKFSKSKIDKAILKLNIQEGLNSLPVIDLMYKTFQLNKYYKRSTIKSKLKRIYEEFDIPVTAVATDVERYFEFRSKDSKDGGDRAYVFTGRKFNTVAMKTHI